MPIFHSIWIRMIWQKEKWKKKEEEEKTRCGDDGYAENEIMYKMEIMLVHYYYYCCFCVVLLALCTLYLTHSTRHTYVCFGALHIWMTMRAPNKSDRFRKRNYEWKLDGFYHFYLVLPLWLHVLSKIGAGGATKWIYTQFFLLFFFLFLINASWIRNKIVYIISGRHFFAFTSSTSISIVVWMRCGGGCGGMKSFSSYFHIFFSHSFIPASFSILQVIDLHPCQAISVWNAWIIEIYVDIYISMIDSNVWKNWQNKSNFAWNCHWQNTELDMCEQIWMEKSRDESVIA